MRWIFLFIFLFLVPVMALGIPESYIDESVSADFYANGTLKSSAQRIGYVSVSVGNGFDVLQYLELNLSGNTGTNLQFIPGTSDVRAYGATAASPTGLDKTRLYMNTTDGPESLYYTLNESVGPLINLTMSYENEDGGSDIHSGLNKFNFTLTIVSSQSLSGVNLRFQAETDTYGNNDAINMVSSSSTSGSTSYINSDGDGFREGIEWVGDLTANQTVTINFDGEITPGINFDNSSFTFLNLAGNCQANYSQSQTFSGITFKNRFSRGPVRQGVELTRLSTWRVRGFLKNMAHDLNYQVNEWKIYEVGNNTPVSSSSVSQTLGPGEILYTNNVDTGRTEKAYYSSYFDWGIVWGTSHYSGISTSNIDMPLLYLIDSTAEKIAVIEQNNEDGRIVVLNDSVTHIGSSEINVSRIEINSTIPHISQEGYQTSWSISDVKVFYRYGGNEIDVTENATVSTKDASGTEDGYVKVILTSTDLGKEMGMGNEIVLRYKVSGSSMDKDSSYTFSSSTLLVTESGTPQAKSVDKTVFLPAVSAGVTPGGGGGGVAADVWIVKEYSENHIISGNIASVKVVYKIYDTGNKGLRNAGLMMLIPEGGELIKEKTDLDIFTNGEWKKLNQLTDYKISYIGLVSVGDKKYNQYNIEFPNGLTLYNQEKVKIKYETTLSYGLNELITKASGYNYYRDKIISEEVHSLIRIDVKLSKFQYKMGEWEQEAAEVGKPVRWLKEIHLKNPNNISAEDIISVKVFKDTISAYIIDNGVNRKIEITPDSMAVATVKMGPGEERTLYLQIFTPPVLETSKKIEPIFSNKTIVVFDMNVSVKNFAKENYNKVVYILPYPSENIIKYSGIKGIESGNTTKLVLGYMISDSEKEFYLRYMQKPPVLIVTTNGFNFTNMNNLLARILVIPTEKEEKGYVETEIIGPEPKLRTMYADIISVNGEAGSMNEFNRTVNLKNFPRGEYILLTNFKKDFVTILTDKKVFHVSGGNIIEIGYEIILLIFLIFIFATFSRMRKKKDKFKEELERLRRKINAV